MGWDDLMDRVYKNIFICYSPYEKAANMKSGGLYSKIYFYQDFELYLYDNFRAIQFMRVSDFFHLLL
jgi:hypothetical protein